MDSHNKLPLPIIMVISISLVFICISFFLLYNNQVSQKDAKTSISQISNKVPSPTNPIPSHANTNIETELDQLDLGSLESDFSELDSQANRLLTN